MNHHNLSDEINRNISKSEIYGGVYVHDHPDFVAADIKAQPVMSAGKGLLIQTKNTLYRLEKRGTKEFYISGHARFCPEPTKAYIAGSTWGGLMLKMGFIGRGMRLEFSTDAHRGITTSEIQEIKEFDLVSGAQSVGAEQPKEAEAGA